MTASDFLTAPAAGAALDDWLHYAENLNVKPIDMGLTRMKTMIDRMGIHFDCPVFTVAGTNGKGSTCALTERILRHCDPCTSKCDLSHKIILLFLTESLLSLMF